MDDLRSIILSAWPEIQLGSLFVLALALGVAAPAGVVLLAGTGRKWSDSRKLTVIMVVLVLASALSALVSGRVFYSEKELAANPALAYGLLSEGGAAKVWLSRLAIAIVLGIAAAEVFRWIQGERRMSPHARQIWHASLLYFVASFVIAAAAGVVRNLHPMVLYTPLLLAGVALLAQDGWFAMVRALRWALWVVMLGSLAAALLAPSMSIERDYPSFFPGMTWRLVGLTDHANSMGALAAVAVLIELSSLVRRRPNPAVLLPALLVLLLAHSKTAWLEAFIGLFMVRFEDIRQRFFSTDKSQFTLAVAAAACMAVAGAVVLGFFLIQSPTVNAFVAANQLDTATGRTMIWSVTLDEFRKSPLFGYGPALWDMQYRIEHGLYVVGQAHNQYVQTLGQAGLIGAAGLAWYIGCLVLGAGRSWRSTHGLSGVILMVLLVRGLSESPMRMGAILGFDPFFHIVAFALALGAGARPEPRTQAALPATASAMR